MHVDKRELHLACYSVDLRGAPDRRQAKNRWESNRIMRSMKHTSLLSNVDDSERTRIWYENIAAILAIFQLCKNAALSFSATPWIYFLQLQWNIYRGKIIAKRGNTLCEKRSSFLIAYLWKKSSAQASREEFPQFLRANKAQERVELPPCPVLSEINYLRARDSGAFVQPCDYSIMCTSPRRCLSLCYEKFAHNSRQVWRALSRGGKVSGESDRIFLISL